MLCRLKICGGITDSRQNGKIKKVHAREVGLFLTSKIFRRHYPIFFSEQNRICFIHRLSKACSLRSVPSSIGSALEKILGAAGGVVKEVVSTIASGVGTLIDSAAKTIGKAIGGAISTVTSWLGW